MKKSVRFAAAVSAAAVAFFGGTGVAGAVEGDEHSYVARAPVVQSAPILETVYELVEVCRYRYVSERSRGGGGGGGGGSTADKLIGGLLGGAAGSAVGKGSGRDAAAGVGALVGSEISAQDGGLSEGELVGGLVGGLVGNQVGGGSGKTAATAAGVLLGSIVGDNLQHGDTAAAAHATTGAKKRVRVCEEEEEPKKIITGYEVTFEHDDYQFTQVMVRDPGLFVDIHVNVQALEERVSSR